MSQLELTPHGVVICHDTDTKALAVFHDSEKKSGTHHGVTYKVQLSGPTRSPQKLLWDSAERAKQQGFTPLTPA
jgi:hypothetical protein